MNVIVVKRVGALAGMFKGFSTLMSISIALGLLMPLPSDASAFGGRSGFEKHAMSNTPLASDSVTEDGAEYYASALKSAEALNDYNVDSAVYTYKGSGRPIVESCKFYFKKPSMIRVEVEKAGIKSGSILTVDADHQIEARPGSLLRFMKVNLSPDSPMLETANGFSMLKVDFATLMKNMKIQADTAGCRLVITGPITTSGPSNTSVRHFQFVLPSNVVLQRIAFDDSTKLPIEWTLFQDGKVFSTSVWSNFKFDGNLPDSLFSLK